MTSNQLQYWRNEEEKRANRRVEEETRRTNLAQERERQRHNIEQEAIDRAKNELTARGLDQKDTELMLKYMEDQAKLGWDFMSQPDAIKDQFIAEFGDYSNEQAAAYGIDKVYDLIFDTWSKFLGPLSGQSQAKLF